jgi:hypothetical protein
MRCDAKTCSKKDQRQRQRQRQCQCPCALCLCLAVVDPRQVYRTIATQPKQVPTDRPSVRLPVRWRLAHRPLGPICRYVSVNGTGFRDRHGPRREISASVRPTESAGWRVGATRPRSRPWVPPSDRPHRRHRRLPTRPPAVARDRDRPRRASPPSAPHFLT